MLATTLPFPKAPRTYFQDRLGFGASEILLNSQAERGGARVSLSLDHPARSLYCVSCRPTYDAKRKCVHGSSRAHYSAQVSERCESGQNKTHTFSKREQEYFSAYHKRPALMQPVCTAVSIPCHTGQGLAGHPQCVNVSNDYGKTKLYTLIRSKTTALPRCAHHHNVQQEHSGPPLLSFRGSRGLMDRALDL